MGCAYIGTWDKVWVSSVVAQHWTDDPPIEHVSIDESGLVSIRVVDRSQYCAFVRFVGCMLALSFEGLGV